MALGVGLCNNGFMHHGNAPLPPQPGLHLSWDRRAGTASGPWRLSRGGETEARGKQMAGWRLPSVPTGEPRLDAGSKACGPGAGGWGGS